MKRHSTGKSATADLMIKLASSIDEARIHPTELEPDAVAGQLIRHLSQKTAQSDLGALVKFFSSGLELAHAAMRDPGTPERRTLQSPGGDRQATESDPSYWFG